MWANSNWFSVVIEPMSLLKQPGMLSIFAFFFMPCYSQNTPQTDIWRRFSLQNTQELDGWEEEALKVDFNGNVPWQRWRFDPERFECFSEQTELSFVLLRHGSLTKMQKFSSQTTSLSETSLCYAFKEALVFYFQTAVKY